MWAAGCRWPIRATIDDTRPVAHQPSGPDAAGASRLLTGARVGPVRLRRARQWQTLIGGGVCRRAVTGLVEACPGKATGEIWTETGAGLIQLVTGEQELSLVHCEQF